MASDGYPFPPAKRPEIIATGLADWVTTDYFGPEENGRWLDGQGARAGYDRGSLTTAFRAGARAWYAQGLATAQPLTSSGLEEQQAAYCKRWLNPPRKITSDLLLLPLEGGTLAGLRGLQQKVGGDEPLGSPPHPDMDRGFVVCDGRWGVEIYNGEGVSVPPPSGTRLARLAEAVVEAARPDGPGGPG